MKRLTNYGLLFALFGIVTFGMLLQTSTRTPFRAGISVDTLESRTQSLYPIINDSLGIVGRIMKYNNIATEGYGVPAIIDTVSVLNSSDSIAATAISNSTPNAFYRIGVYLECTGADAGTDSVYAKITWYDVSGNPLSDSTGYLALTGEDTYLYKQFFVYHSGGGSNNIYYSTVHSEESADEYALKLYVERMN